jgi:cobalt-zinc-cadmium efflux system membrane fusion protein
MSRAVVQRCYATTLVLLLVILANGLLSCQGRQEEPAKQPSGSTAPTGQVVLELPEGSVTLATLKTERVGVRPLKVVLRAQAGKILPNENRLAHLSPRVPGRIVDVYANLGDRVKTGDQLLLLDSPELGERQLEYRKARTRLGVAEKALDRAKVLLERGAISQAEYQRREAEYENALADVRESEEKLHLLGMTEDEIARLARKDLPHAQVAQVPLRAPFTGEVIERNATVGEVVDPTKVLFTVADLSTVWVRADFPEHQVARLRKGLPIELRVAAYPKEVFRGVITYVAAVVDPATRTLMVRSDVPNPDRRLRPEMFAEVSLIIEEQPVLAMPRAALQQVGDHTAAFLVVGLRRFELREITIGQSAGDYVEVTGGLVGGDEVVTEGSYALKSELLREQMPAGGPL